MDTSFLSRPEIALSLLFAVSVFLLFFGIDRLQASRSTVMESRYDRYATREADDALATDGAKKTRGNRLRNMGGGKRGSQIATELSRADLRLTVGEYLLINLGTVVVGVVVGLLLFRGNFVFGLIGGVIGFYAPRFYVRHLQKKRLNSFNNQLGDTIVLLSNSLRSGYSMLQSMETVSRELPPPISVEFTRVTREIGLGLTTQEALGNLLRRIPSDDLDLMVTAINVQHEVGGNLAEILDNIAHTIRERVRIVGEIRTITAQQRLTGTILSILPIILGMIIYALNPGYISRLWQDTCGILMMGTGALLIFLGYLAVRRIATIEV